MANQALLQKIKQASPALTLMEVGSSGPKATRRGSIETLNLEVPALTNPLKRRYSSMEPLNLEVPVTKFARGISALSHLLCEDQLGSGSHQPIQKTSFIAGTSQS